MSRKDWQELAFTLTIGLLMLLALFVMFILLPHPFEIKDANKFLKNPSDIPLLTKQEKIWAQETGVASYHVNGELYVDYGLPSEYWSGNGDS